MNLPSRYTKFKVISGYVLLFILTIATITFIYKQISRFTDKENFVSATNQKLYLIGNTIASLYEAETLSNSFLQTGSERAFHKYIDIVRQVESNIDSLKGMTTEPGQEARIDTIHLLLNDKIKNLKELLKVKKSKESTDYYNKAIALIESTKDSVPPTPNIRKRVITTRDSSYVATVKKKKWFLGIFSTKEPDTTLQIRESEHIIWDTLPPVSAQNNPDTIVHILKYAWESFQAEAANLNRQISRREFNIVNQSVQITEQLKKVLYAYEKEEIAYSLKRIEEREQVMDSAARLIAIIAIVAVLFIAFFCTLILKDISRSQRYRKQLEEANAYTARLLKSREQLMLTVTHDIKSPLSSVTGYIELLNSSQIDNRQRYFLKNMKSSSDHIQKLITNLLDLSKLENNRLIVEEIIFNPAQLFHEIADTFLPLATAKNLILNCDIHEDLDTTCKGDALRIRQIITNILSNAVKYTESGTITFTATTSEDKRMTFRIKDTGPGMTPGEQKLIFQEFTRLKSHASIEGTGLGLTITLKLIHLLKGEMTLESEPGKGSCFTVSLPLDCTPTDTEIPQAKTEVQIPSLHKPNDKQIKVLLVDDDPLQLEMTSGLLQNYGIQTACTDNPQKVTGKLEKENYDIVFSDIQMPGMTGFELVKQIREKHFTVPVVALSADSGKTKTDYLNAGFTAYLGKPFTSAQLLEIICQIYPDSFSGSLHRQPATSPVLPAGQNGYSLKQIQQFTDNDPEATRKILRSFVSETRKHLQELKKYADEKRMEKIAGLAHKMLPMFRQLETEEIICSLQTLERDSLTFGESEKLTRAIIEKTQTLLQTLEMDLGIDTD